MGYLILTTVKDERYWLFKKNGSRVDVFSDDETVQLKGLLAKDEDTFGHIDTLHRTIFEVRKVDLKKEEAGRSLLKLAKLNAVAKKTGVEIVAIKQGEMTKYNNCT